MKAFFTAHWRHRKPPQSGGLRCGPYLLSGRQFSTQKYDFVFCGKGEKSPVASKYCGKPLRGCVGSRSAAGAAALRLVGARIQCILKNADFPTWGLATCRPSPKARTLALALARGLRAAVMLQVVRVCIGMPLSRGQWMCVKSLGMVETFETFESLYLPHYTGPGRSGNL